MVENATLEYLQDLFKDFAFKEKIKFFPNNGFSNYEIETKFGYTIVIYYEYIDNLYNVNIRYSSEELSLTSYDLYKKFIKSNLSKGPFKKHNFKEHLYILFKFINKYKDKIRIYDVIFNEVNLTKEKYKNIFI